MQVRFAANFGWEELLVAVTLPQTSVALFKWLQEVSENMLWRCSGKLFAMFWQTFSQSYE